MAYNVVREVKILLITGPSIRIPIKIALFALLSIILENLWLKKSVV